eukprot:scaffold39051_cov98-Cyclotella_meneghiniana.AAC.1
MLQWPQGDHQDSASGKRRAVVNQELTYFTIVCNRTIVDLIHTSFATMPSTNSASFNLMPRGSASSSPGFADPTAKPVVTVEKATQRVLPTMELC